MKNYEFVGKHLLAELFGVDKDILNDVCKMRNIFLHSLNEINVNICNIAEKEFSPSGITILLLLSESHASLHTYPENESMFLDIFTCGNCEPEEAFLFLLKELKPKSYNKNLIVRK